MAMSPINTSRRQLSARTLAVTESEHPASATTRHSVPADYSCIGECGVAAGRPTHIRQLCAAVAAKNWRKRVNQITGKAVPVRAGVAVRDCDMVIGIGGRGATPPGG